MITFRSPFPIKKPLNIAVVQMKISRDDYSSETSFSGKIARTLSAIQKQIPSGEDTLVAFPEDIGIGLILTPDFNAVKDCETLPEAGKRILIRHTPTIFGLATKHKIPITRALLINASRTVEQIYDHTFSSLSARFGYYISAGSAPISREHKIYNESRLYAPDGKVISKTRKINLVEIESDGGLCFNSSDTNQIQCVDTPFGKVGAAICLDAFHSEITDKLAECGANIIIQPSFNPKPWTNEQSVEWETGLKLAVQKHKGVIGINPMMVGRLLDITAEGRSSVVVHGSLSPTGDGYITRALSHDSEEILVVRLEA